MTDQGREQTLPVRATLTMQGEDGKVIFDCNQVAMFRAVQDTTRVEHSYRSFKASGDEVVVLVKWGKGSRASARVEAALEELHRALSHDPDEAWMAGYR